MIIYREPIFREIQVPVQSVSESMAQGAAKIDSPLASSKTSPVSPFHEAWVMPLPCGTVYTTLPDLPHIFYKAPDSHQVTPKP